MVVDSGPFDGGPPNPWAQSAGGDAFFGVAVDPQANVIAVGNKASNADLFVVKYDAAGSPQWQKWVNGSAWAFRVTTDAAGGIYFIGHSISDFSFEGKNVPKGGYVIKLDKQGAYVWHRSINGYPWWIGTKSNNNIVIAGELSGAHDFGGGTVTPQFAPDAFAVEITGSNQYVRAKNWGGTSGSCAPPPWTRAAVRSSRRAGSTRSSQKWTRASAT